MRIRSILGLAAALTISGCIPLSDAPDERVGSAGLKSADGTSVGNVQIFASETKAVISAAFFRMPAGPHAVHLHTVGKCEGPEFKSAGGHLNPSQNDHGNVGRGGHLGDLPNVTIPSAGNATYQAIIEGPKDDILAHIFDENGTTLMVHARADDYRTNPSGAAGPRIACGVLKSA